LIQVRIDLDGDACVASLVAIGHAGGGAAGENLACAAFTLLVRTAWEALGSYASLSVEGKAEKPGDLSFRVTRLSEEHRGEHRGISDFLRVGLAGIARDFPGRLKIDIR
jgi:uncharacterized protein YsxB (DUF464 family)